MYVVLFRKKANLKELLKNDFQFIFIITFIKTSKASRCNVDVYFNYGMEKKNFLVLLYKQIRTTKAIHVVCYYFKSMIKRFSPHANNWLRLFSPTISHFVKIPNKTTDCRE